MAKGSSTSSKGKSKQPNSTPAPTKPKFNPPAPYSTPPPALKPLLDTLNPKHVYITHIDRHPRTRKTNVFAMTAFINLAIAFVLIWRANNVLPYYASILFAMGGHDPGRPPKLGTNFLINQTMDRTFNFFLDFMLFRFAVPWPLDFFIGNASPTTWRLTVGFQDEEIGVRKSRKWDEKLPENWLAEEADGAVYKERIMPAIDRQWIKEKTSYLMMDKSWDLDFVGMVLAHDFVKKGTCKLQDFEKTVIVHSEEFGWLVWQVWKLDEGAEDEGRQKILDFQKKLTEMGKEDLFYRWIELVQYETSQPGGFSKERQAKTMEEARKLFQSHGVDFDEFWKEVGGDAITQDEKSSSVAI